MPKDLVDLPAAGENKVFHVDMTYTLKEDITGADGKVIYPKVINIILWNICL